MDPRNGRNGMCVLVAVFVLAVGGNARDDAGGDKQDAIKIISNIQHDDKVTNVLLRHALSEHYEIASKDAVGYKEVVAKGINDVHVKYRQCINLIDAGDVEAGLTLVKGEKEEYVNDPIVLCVLAEQQFDRGDFRKSEELFNKALKIHPLMPRAHLGLSEIAMCDGREELMIKHCSRVLLVESGGSPLASRAMILLKEILIKSN